MKFIGTILWGSSAFSVYSEEGKSLLDEWNDRDVSNEDTVVLLKPHLKLVCVTDEPSPSVLPKDLSPSLEAE